MTEHPRLDTAYDGDSMPPSWDDATRTPTAEDRQALGSPLDQLRASMAQEPDVEEFVTLKVTARPGVSVKYSTDLDNETIEMWRRASRRKKARPGQDAETDELKFACLVLAGQCKGVLTNGQEVFDDDGRPLTFASPLLWDMVGAAGQQMDPMTVIRKFYVRDAHVSLTSGEILLDAGFGDEVERESPTTAS